MSTDPYMQLTDAELSAAVAERVMGQLLTPPEHYKKEKIGSKYISHTGPTFGLRTEPPVEINMPEDLPILECDYGNGGHPANPRYSRYIYDWLWDNRPEMREELKEKAKSLRLPSEPYATDLNAAAQAVEKFCGGKWVESNSFDYIRPLSWVVGIGDDYPEKSYEWAKLIEATPRQRCIALLRALDERGE